MKRSVVSKDLIQQIYVVLDFHTSIRKCMDVLIDNIFRVDPIFFKIIGFGLIKPDFNYKTIYNKEKKRVSPAYSCGKFQSERGSAIFIFFLNVANNFSKLL